MVAEQVTKMIAEKLQVDAAKVLPGSHITDDLGADSLDTVELAMDFEDHFSIEIPDEDMLKLVTVRDAICYVEQKYKKN